jgi:hypothetical protein
MNFPTFVRVAAVVSILGAGPALGQIGLYSLPKDNFIWRWGDSENARGIADFSISGGESGFHCDLTGRLSPASRLSPSDVRALEQELRSRLDFIYASATYMNNLDATRDLDWATLDCKRPEATPSTEEEKAEREAKAREKMMREIERRRARQQDQPD